MMMLVRLFPIKDKHKLWDCVLPILKEIKSEHCQPLYLSEWEPVDFITVMVDVINIDCMYKIWTQDLSKCKELDRSRTLTLMSPIFYPVPKDRPEKLHRYRIALQIDTAHLENIFNKIIDIDLKKINIYPTYQAYSFGEDDILLSILSESESNIDTLIQQYLAPLEGVKNVEYIGITRSHRIAPTEFWREYRKKLYKVPITSDSGEMDEDFDWSEEDIVGLSGGFVDEM